jgi:hypothetical protein
VKRERHEFLFAEYVGDGFMSGAAFKKRPVTSLFLLCERSVKIEIELQAAKAKGVSQEELGVQAWA